MQLGPSWLGGQQSGEITTLATRGLDALDPYFARYLPQLVLACLVPVAVLIRVGLADWISGLVILATLPLIPVFAVLIGLHTKAQTQRQWRLLARLGGHFLDVVEGLTTLKVFGRDRAQAEVIGQVTDQHRRATMAALRVAFLSSLVLELAATIATALVAVEVGLRLLAGHMSYQTALLVLILTPEAYLPLRNVGAQFHASMEGTTAAERVFAILATQVPAARHRHRPIPAPATPAGAGLPARRNAGLSRPAAAGPRRREPDGASGRAPGDYRAERGRQELAAGAAAAVLRADARRDRGRRPGPDRDTGGGLAGAGRLGAAAAAPVRDQHRRATSRLAGREAAPRTSGSRPGWPGPTSSSTG